MVTPVYATIVPFSTPGPEKRVHISQDFDVGFTFTLSDIKACLIFLQIEYPEDLIQYASYLVQCNGDDISSSFKVSLGEAALLIGNEETLSSVGTYVVTTRFTASSEAGRGSLSWRGIVTTFSTPSTPPDVWDEVGATTLIVVSPEVHVVGLEASPATVRAGQSTSMLITVKNNYTSSVREQLQVLLNGEQYIDVNVSLDPLEMRVTRVEVSSEKMGFNTVTVKGVEASFTVSSNLSVYYFIIIAISLVAVLVYVYNSLRR